MSTTGAVADVLDVLAPASVGAALLKRCISLEWPPGVSELSMPDISVSASNAEWVGEGLPAPVVDFATSRVTVGPKKLASICVFSREMSNYSTPAIETLVRVALSESVGLALDARLFSATVADALSPPGLFVGIAPLPASTQSLASEAMAEDIATLVAAVAAVAGNSDVILVASPRQWAALRVRLDIGAFQVYQSAALPDKTVAAVATRALFSVGMPIPQFTVDMHSTYHMENATPAAIGTPASPPVVAAPARSLWQTDCVGLLMKFNINWALRNSAGVAWVQGTAW